MSEPEAALLKFQVTRPTLTRWLRTRPPLASRWDDWRSIGGTWEMDGERMALADAPQAKLVAFVRDADRALAAAPDNRELLHDLVTETAETVEPDIHRAELNGRPWSTAAGRSWDVPAVVVIAAKGRCYQERSFVERA